MQNYNKYDLLISLWKEKDKALESWKKGFIDVNEFFKIREIINVAVQKIESIITDEKEKESK